MSANPSRIFISYRWVDTGHATRLLAATLKQAFGPKAVFLDTEAMQIGEWPAEIQRNLGEADVTLVVIGRHWLSLRNRRRLGQKNDWVRREISESISREVKIIPLPIDAKLPKARALPPSLRKLPRNLKRDLRYSSWDSDVEGLIRCLEESGFKRVRAKQAVTRKRRLPRIILMDSYEKIYDQKSKAVGMNSHVIRGLLQEMPVEPIRIEPVHLGWQGSDAIAKSEPDLIIIHYSCMDQPGRPLNLLHFLTYMLFASSNTKVIVYSRTTGKPGELMRTVDRLGAGYNGRVFALPIHGGKNRARNFSDPRTAAALRKLVVDALALQV
jgi:TIR domain